MDHVVPFSEGGPTTQENAQVLCGPHNRMRYERPPPDG
jgi:5-methylcytosine-specific restriction endonuclease McrA